MSGQDGGPLWQKQIGYRVRPVVVGDTLHAEPWAYRIISDVQPPLDLRRRRPDEHQMERLRRLVQEKRIWTVERWLPRATPSGSKGLAVEYRHATDLAQEIVILDVASLNQEKPIIGSIDDFWEAHHAWTEASESLEPFL